MSKFEIRITLTYKRHFFYFFMNMTEINISSNKNVDVWFFMPQRHTNYNALDFFSALLHRPLDINKRNVIFTNQNDCCDHYYDRKCSIKNKSVSKNLRHLMCTCNCNKYSISSCLFFIWHGYESRTSGGSWTCKTVFDSQPIWIQISVQSPCIEAPRCQVNQLETRQQECRVLKYLCARVLGWLFVALSV